MPLAEIWLQPKQCDLWDAIEAKSGPTVLGFGGARGSAKSGALRRIAILLAENHKGIVIYIVRRVLGDLLENHMEKIALEFPNVDALYRPSDYEYDFPNGSRIVFVYAETAIDVRRVSYGPECTFLFIDQAEQFSEEELLSFRICNRWPTSSGVLPKTCFFFNVGVGVGAGYLRRIFHLRTFRDNEEPADYAFTQAYGWDNYEWFRGHIPETIEQFYGLSNNERFHLFITRTPEGKKMNALPEHRRQGELLGSFNAFSGQYFSDVWGEHCILSPDEVLQLSEPWWTGWMAQDWGFGDHTSHGWYKTGIVSPEKWEAMFGGKVEWPIEVIIRYREYLVNGRAEADMMNDIIGLTPEAERKQLKDFFVSEDAFGQRAKQAGANTVGECYVAKCRSAGLPLPSPAIQDRVNGWRFLYNCLRQATMRGANVDKARAVEGPVLFISANCPAAIENIPLAVRDDKDPNDVMRVAGAVWEDVTDEIRYSVASKLSPRQKAPVAVRRAEVAAAAIDNTQKHLALMRFDQQEKRRTNVTRARRWR